MYGVISHNVLTSVTVEWKRKQWLTEELLRFHPNSYEFDQIRASERNTKIQQKISSQDEPEPQYKQLISKSIIIADC
jgi:hypothetical protein